MPVELWQLTHARRALNDFCAERQIGADDAAALTACEGLLALPFKSLQEPEQLDSALQRVNRSGPAQRLAECGERQQSK